MSRPQSVGSFGDAHLCMAKTGSDSASAGKKSATSIGVDKNVIGSAIAIDNQTIKSYNC